MARCESIEILRQKILATEVEKMETSDDSDSESDISYILDLDMSQVKGDSNPHSTESIHNDDEEQVITGPVLSLKCLHEDTDEESESSKSHSDQFNGKYIIDAKDVPELSLNCPDKDLTKLIKQEVLTEAVEEKDIKQEVYEVQTQNVQPESILRQNHEPVNITIENVSSLVSVVPQHNVGTSIPNILVSRVTYVPARSHWEGAHNFKIKIDCGGKQGRTDSPVYSESRNKLYVCKDYPFKVLVSAENVPVGSVIKVTASFTMAEHSFQIVRRCPSHAQQDFNKGKITYQHFVQCLSDFAVYERSLETGRLGVSVPYEVPKEGETVTTYLFKLTCFSSCSSGINRRPFVLIFSLEKNNIPLGRQIVEAKVCACPSRDYKADVERENKKSMSDNISKSSEPLPQSSSSKKVASKYSNSEKVASKYSNSENVASKYSNSENVASKYSITVKDPHLFEFLRQMKVLYETGAACCTTSPVCIHHTSSSSSFGVFM